MHPSVLEFLNEKLAQEEVARRKVLEVGSRDVNGAARRIIEAHGPESYVGTDMIAGPGVDVVCDAQAIYPRWKDIDVLVCVETLEHIEFWKQAVRAMKECLRPGGVILLTTRSPGFPYHAHPGDFWRFTKLQMRLIFSDFAILELSDDPQPHHPGVFLKAMKPANHSHVNLDIITVQSVG